MYYFKYNDTIIEKYVVKYNKNKLVMLRDNIIDNCSRIIHKESNIEPFNNFNTRIMNLKVDSINGESYHYSYDECKYPMLVGLIDMILRNNDASLDNLYIYKQQDMASAISEEEKEVIAKYYSSLLKLLSFELLSIIDFSDLSNDNYNSNKKQRKLFTKKRNK